MIHENKTMPHKDNSKNKEAIDIANSISLTQLQTILQINIDRLTVWDEGSKTLHDFDGVPIPVSINGGSLQINVNV